MATQIEVVDYHSLARRELQNLCKKHGIPANKTNAYMADALSSLSKVNHPSGFGSVDEGGQSVPCQIKDQNEMGDTVASADAEKNYRSPSKIGSKRIELMEEDTVPAVKDTYLEEFAGKDAQRVTELGDDATGTSKGQCFMLHIESHVDGQDDLGQAYADKKDAEGSQNSISRSSPCKETNKVNDNQSNTPFEKRSIHISVSSLDQVGDLPMNVSPACSEYASTKKKEIGEKHQEEAITGDEATETFKGQCFMLHAESHVDGQDDLGQSYEDADKKVAEGSQNRICRSSPYNQSSIAFEKRSIHTGVDSLDQVVDLAMDVSPACSEYASTMKKEVGEKLQEEAITGNGTRYKTVSLDTDTASLVLDKIADSSICLNHRRLQNYCSDETEKKNQSHICNRDRMVLLAEQTVVDDAVQNDSVYSGDAKLKKCPVKNPTAETSGSSFQFLVECDNGIKLSVDLAKDSPLNWMKTCNYEFSLPRDLDDHKHDRGDTVMTNTTNGSATLGDLRPQIPDIESSANLNQIACSSNFLQSQNVSFTSPVFSTKKPESSRELRRTSSVLIPPHGANRGLLSPFISQKSSRFSSPLNSSHKANRFLFPSSAVARGKHWTSVSEEIDKSSCLSERSEPMTAEPSKVVEDFNAQSGAPEKNGLLSLNEPLNDGCPDVEMAEQSLHSSMKMSKNEVGEQQDIQHKGKVFHNLEKEAESISQVHYSLEKAQKENLIKDFQAEEPRNISRYKDSYKKSPFTKNLRGMKILARASAMRTDILAKRRAMPFAEKDSAHSQPSLHLSQNVQEIQTEHARETLEISPGVYHDRDLCVSGLNLGKNPSPSQNAQHMLASSTLLAPGTMDDATVIGREDSRKSSTGISESYHKVSAWPIKAFARRRFLERALAESRERIQAQKMQHTANNNCFSTEKQVAYKLSSNNVYAGYENQKSKSACILQELNSTNSNIFETENEYSERVTERQKRHQEQFKTPLTGKSKKKAIEIAKRMALVQRNEILKSKRGITSGI